MRRKEFEVVVLAEDLPDEVLTKGMAGNLRILPAIVTSTFLLLLFQQRFGLFNLAT
ncbi:hypothetical protein [Scandinavium tedordense]|uniref:hypothetical protein n=1 Tax=Scandinavium tedordense TaxID=2926521 RepID=UPI0035B23B06